MIDTAESKIGSKNKIYYMHLIIYLIILFGIGLIPPFGAISVIGMKVLGVFIGTIYGWLTLGLIWPSIFSLVALGLVGYGNAMYNRLSAMDLVI